MSERPSRAHLTSIEAAGIAGIVCARGWTISLCGLLAEPAIDTSDAEIIRYFSDSDAGVSGACEVSVGAQGF